MNNLSGEVEEQRLVPALDRAFKKTHLFEQNVGKRCVSLQQVETVADGSIGSMESTASVCMKMSARLLIHVATTAKTRSIRTRAAAYVSVRGAAGVRSGRRGSHSSTGFCVAEIVVMTVKVATVAYSVLIALAAMLSVILGLVLVQKGLKSPSETMGADAARQKAERLGRCSQR
eukprot:4591578-Pleurochrysis_carterae.AAC.2